MTTTPPQLSSDLLRADVPVSDLWELVNGKVAYRAAIPVLIDWLDAVDARVPEADRRAVREGLVRALTLPAARPAAAPVLIRAFRNAHDPSGLGIRWVIGNALSVVADDSVFDQIAELVSDRRYGKGRQMAVLALGRSKDPRAASVLTSLLSDPDVTAHAVMALAKLKPAGARAAVEPLLKHPQALVRREAKKALAKLPPGR